MYGLEEGVSKQRLVDTCFWDDGYVVKLDPSEKLLFLYLLTNPLTTLCGVYQIEVRRISFDTGFDADTVGRMLARFERDDKCLYLDGWVAMRNWLKHQRTRNTSIRKGIDRELSLVPPALADWVRGGKKPGHARSRDVTSGHVGSRTRDVGSRIRAVAPNLTQPNSTQPNQTQPNLAVAAGAAKGVSLHRSVQEAFESRHGTFSDYGKEGKAIQYLIAKAEKFFPDDPGGFLRSLLGAFWTLKQSGDKFWSEQPFTPSALNASGIFDRVCERLRADEPVSPEVAEAIERVFKR
jgi:hypothetical protein